MKYPPIKLLKKFVRYSPDTGKLYWMRRLSKAAGVVRWNGRCAGDEIDKKGGTKGYKHVRIQGRYCVSQARAVWAFETGAYPTGADQIDHINGDKRDNRFCNLRLVSNRDNCKNKKVCNSNTGVTGVSKLPSGSYAVTIGSPNRGGRRSSVPTLAEAIALRLKWKHELGYTIRHGVSC